MQDLEREIGDVIRPTTGTSLLGKVVHMLVGINTVVHDDATLAVTSFESDEDGRGMPLSVGDTIIEVSERTCAWYRGMSLEEILVHLQVRVPVLSRPDRPWPAREQLLCVCVCCGCQLTRRVAVCTNILVAVGHSEPVKSGLGQVPGRASFET